MNAISRKKTQDKIVKALEPKILANNISCIHTSVNADAYNVATDVLSWEGILNNILRFCGHYDMVLLLMISMGVDYSKPHQVAKAANLKDTIKDWHSFP